jgi:hypothetical protein
MHRPLQNNADYKICPRFRTDYNRKNQGHKLYALCNVTLEWNRDIEILQRLAQ